jgi:hypothetical protein
MNVGIPICGKGAKGLDGAYHAGSYVIAVEKCLKSSEDALGGGLREKGEQGAFAFEKAAKRLGNGKREVSMRYGFQDLFLEFFCEQDGALGLAARAKVSCVT